MPEFLSPSIQVVEVRQGVADVQGVSTSTGGFIGKAEKGPINDPQLIVSTTQFQEVFGSPLSDSVLFEQVDAFFKNGGSRCYVCRVAHYTDINDAGTLSAIKAAKTFQSAVGGATPAVLSGTESAPFNLEPNDDLSVDVDGGGAATATFLADAAAAAGSGATYASMDGKTIVFQIDADGDDQTVTFTSGATDAASTAAEFNAAARKCRMEVNGAEVDIVSDKRGTGSSVEIKVASTGLTELGHSVGTSSGSGNVADIDAVTHAEAKLVIEAAIGATYLPASGGGTPSLTSPTPGSASTLEVTAGSARTKFGFPTGEVTGSDSAGAEDTIQVKAASEGGHGNRLRITITRQDTVVTQLSTSIAAGATVGASLKSVNQLRVGDYVSIADGTNSIRVLITNISGKDIEFASVTVAAGGIVASTSSVTRERFTIQAEQDGTVLATFSELAADETQLRDYFVTRINNTSGSPIEVVDLAASAPDPRPAAASSQALTGGSDGSALVDLDYVGSAATSLGLYAMDAVDAVNMLSVPGITTSTVQKALLDYCDNRADLIAVMTVPQGLSPTEAVTYVAETANLVSSYGAIYYPHLKILSQLTGVEALTPVDGFAQGIFARTDRIRNVAKAPAGTVDGRVSGITGLERKVSKGEYDVLYPSNINAVLSIAGAGTSIFGSRTLETGEFRQISHRRLFMFIEESLADASLFVLFEDNEPETRAAVTRLYKSFLRNLRLAKMLKGDSDDEAFFVICDERNNPLSVVNSGLLKARVGVALRRPVEFMQIEVQQDTRALDAELG